MLPSAWPDICRLFRIAEYDWMFDRYELVERPNDHTSVRWTCYRAIWPTRPRDFVIRSTWEEFADGTIVISTRSVEHEDYPETPTFVRGKMVKTFCLVIKNIYINLFIKTFFAGSAPDSQ